MGVRRLEGSNGGYYASRRRTLARLSPLRYHRWWATKAPSDWGYMTAKYIFITGCVVISRARRGDYLRRTIQPIPHVTNEIKERIRGIGRDSGAEVVILEVGGTVGDIEGQPFLEAIRQMRNEEGRHDTVAIHVTLLPYISTTGELNTKPTQHSVP